jgi:phosphate transport system substrate-binding protein
MGQNKKQVKLMEPKPVDVISKRSSLMNIRSLLLVVIIVMFLLTGCNNAAAFEAEPTPVGPAATLTISGSGSVTAVLSGIQAAFEADNPGYHLEVLPGSGTGGGVQGIVQGMLDVAGMARPPKDEEAAQQVEYVEFGQAGQAVITHAQVGVTDLTSAQVAAIFSGEITDWSEVGGPILPVILYVRDEGDSSTKALRSVIMGDSPFADTVAQVLTSQNDMQSAVAGTPGSVGIATWPAALAERARVKAIAIDGLAPGDAGYPMVSPLGLGYLTDRQAEVQPLVDWLRSESGQAALQKLDVIVSQ